MTKKDYELIATVIWRAGFIKDKNKVKQQAKEDRTRLIISGFIGELKGDNPNFDAFRFEKACKGGNSPCLRQ